MTRDQFIAKYAGGHYGDMPSLRRRLSEFAGLIYDLIGGSGLDDLETSETDSLVDAINELVTNIGTLSTLSTTEKTEIVGAINEIVTNIGTLSSLSTTEKTDLVAALNEVVANVATNSGKLGAEATPVDGAKAAVTIVMTNDNADLTYTAQDYGAAGNDITVTHVDPSDTDQELAVSVDGTDITISLATDETGAITSSANLVKAEIEATPAAAALVAVTVDGTGEGIVNAVVKDALEGGVDVTPGEIGSLRFDDTNFYVKISAQVWKKVAHSSL